MPLRQRSTAFTSRSGRLRRSEFASRSGGHPTCPDREQARRLNEEELKRLSKDDLATLARDEQLPRRSKMNKAQLARTLRRHYRQAR